MPVHGVPMRCFAIQVGIANVRCLQKHGYDALFQGQNDGWGRAVYGRVAWRTGAGLIFTAFIPAFAAGGMMASRMRVLEIAGVRLR